MARAAAVVTAVLGLGCVFMAVAHAGVEVPVLSALGPPGGAVVPPAAAGFAVAAAVFAVVLVGLLRARPWAWATALVAHALTLVGAAVPFRGVGSAVGIALALAAIALLLTPSARSDLLRRG